MVLKLNPNDTAILIEAHRTINTILEEAQKIPADRTVVMPEYLRARLENANNGIGAVVSMSGSFPA